MKISFSAFFLMYVEGRLGLEAPDFHLDACDFLQEFAMGGENDPDVAVLMFPRGHSKSTNLDIFNAWLIYEDPEHWILHQGTADRDAYKCSRGTLAVLKTHPLTENNELFKKREGTTSKWWVNGSTDERYGTFFAAGILSGVTGQRATFIENDDVETPKTTNNQEKREKLKTTLSEQTHIAVPNTKTLYIGTPHSHDSLYTHLIEKGAKTLILKMFEKEYRIEKGQTKAIIPFAPVHAFAGIGKGAKYLYPDKDYSVHEIDGFYHIEIFGEHNLVDFYSKSIWEKRFTPKEMEKRRVKCETINEWDSQYQMHARPVGNMRLDPDYLKPYSEEPRLVTANGEARLYIGENRIVSVSAHLDPSSGKKNRDVSSFTILFQDDIGRLYWHRSAGLTGKIINVDEEGNICTGGQAWTVADLVKEFNLPAVTVETNGIGGHVPDNLLAVFKKRKIRCAVQGIHESKNKNIRILGAIEGPLLSGYLYAHESILKDENGNDSDIVKKMRVFNPETQDNPDDEIDSLAKAISNEPVRMGRNLEHFSDTRPDWRGIQTNIKAKSAHRY
jgi:hypothetical protein